MVAYSLMMWLPYYLVNHIKASTINEVTLITLFEVSGIISSIVAGSISDKLNSRIKVVITMVISIMPIFLLFRFGDENSVWIYYFLVPASGCLIIACSNLVSSCVATDLAHHTESIKNTHAMATVTGIIDGTGSLGAACGQFFIGWIQVYDWDYVFYFMVLIGGVSIIILVFPLYELSWFKKKSDDELSIKLISIND